MKLSRFIIFLLFIGIILNVINYTCFLNLLSFIWYIASILIIYLAIKLSIKYHFLQFNIKELFKSIKTNNNTISSIDSVCISLGAKVGVGSLSGVALAIYYGGIGSIFWLIIISLFVSINAYMESILGIKYHIKKDNNYFGGPSYYINSCLNDKCLSILYSVLVIISYSVFFLSIQANTIVKVISIFKIKQIYIVLILVFITAIVLVRGMVGIAKVSRKLVPIMLCVYALLGIYILIINIKMIPNIFFKVIKEAFSLKGIIPAFLIGMERAIFITESSIGTSAIAASISNNDGNKQGKLEILGIHIAIFLIVFTTFILIVTANYNLNITSINGIEMVIMAFSYHFGKYGEIFLVIITILFAFSTIIASYCFGLSNISIFNNSVLNKIYFYIFIFVIFISCYFKANILWNMIDYLMALLAIINIYSIIRILYKKKSFVNNIIGEDNG